MNDPESAPLTRCREALREIADMAKQGAEGVMRLYFLNKIEARSREALSVADPAGPADAVAPACPVCDRAEPHEKTMCARYLAGGVKSRAMLRLDPRDDVIADAASLLACLNERGFIMAGDGVMHGRAVQRLRVSLNALATEGRSPDANDTSTARATLSGATPPQESSLRASPRDAAQADADALRLANDHVDLLSDALKRRGDALFDLFAAVTNSSAQAYLHSGCGCEWGSRGERSASPSCRVDAMLERCRHEVSA